MRPTLGVARRPHFSLAAFTAGLALAAAGCTSVPFAPEALPSSSETFRAPYDAVWDATLKGLGIVKLRVIDKATGRIETEPFSFAFPIGSGQGGNTQVLWIALKIDVRQTGENRIAVRVEPQVHHALLYGFTPGPTNNPWVDLFGKIANQLGARREAKAAAPSLARGPTHLPRSAGRWGDAERGNGACAPEREREACPNENCGKPTAGRDACLEGGPVAQTVDGRLAGTPGPKSPLGSRAGGRGGGLDRAL